MSIVKQGDYNYKSLISNDKISLILGKKIRAYEQQIKELEALLDRVLNTGLSDKVFDAIKQALK